MGREFRVRLKTYGGPRQGERCEVGQSPLRLCSGLLLGLAVGTGNELEGYLQAAALQLSILGWQACEVQAWHSVALAAGPLHLAVQASPPCSK